MIKKNAENLFKVFEFSLTLNFFILYQKLNLSYLNKLFKF